MVLWNAKEMQEREHREGRTSHSAANDDPHLQKLWKCKVPPKVRVFWWRVSHDFMPYQANLHRKHIERLGTCSFCGMEEETTFHSLTQCEFAISFCDKFRALTGIKLPKLCPRTWTRDLLENSFCSEEDRGVILCGMWSLWRGRNDRRHAKRPIDPGAALDWALEVCRQLTKTKQASTQQAQPVPWCSPEVGTLKINIDGSFLQNSHTGATGALMRDSNGVLRAASARCLDSVGSALQAEAEALRDGGRLIPESTTEHVILETDSQHYGRTRANIDRKLLQSLVILRR